MTMQRRRVIVSLLLISILISPPLAFAQFNWWPFPSLFPPQSEIAPPVGRPSTLTTYANGWWGGSVRSRSEFSLDNFAIPQALRYQTAENAGWASNANTPSENVRFSSRTDGNLARYDKYGMSVFLNVPLSGYGCIGPCSLDTNWARDVVAARPNLRTLDKNGNDAAEFGYIRVDHPEFSDQLFQDIMQLYSYYGDHPSWTGFTEVGGWASDLGYYYGVGPPVLANNERPTYMLGRQSIINFANSAYCQDGSSAVSKCSHLATLANDPGIAYKNIRLYHQKFERGANSFNNWPSYNQIQFLKGWDTAIQRVNAATGRNFQFGVWPFDPYMTQDDFDLPTIIYGSGHNYCPLFPPDGPHFSDAALGSLKVGNNPHMATYTSGDGGCPIHTSIMDFQLRMSMPFAGGEPIGFGISNPTRAESGNESPGSLTFEPLNKYGAKLNKMWNVGTYYGSELSKVKVLLMGGWATNTPQFLTPALDITISGEGSSKTLSDSTLTRYGNFNQFDVILLSPGPGKDSISSSLRSRIQTFVQNGGGLVMTGPGYNTPGLESVMGFQPDGTKGGGVRVVQEHLITKPYSSLEIARQISYATSFKTPIGSAQTVILQDGSGPIMFTNRFGQGRSAFIPYTGNSGWSSVGGQGMVNGIFGGLFASNGGGTPRDSYIVILTNAVLWASKHGGDIPAWWYDSPNGWTNNQPWSEDVYYSVLGSPGEPPLVWFFNDGDGSAIVDIHLSASYFGVNPNGWTLMDTENWSVIKRGSGNDIGVRAIVPGKGWATIYVLSLPPDRSSMYSNVNLISSNTLGRQATYVLDGPHNFSSWLITRSDTRPQSVSTNIQGALSRFNDRSTLENSPSGYFFDANNGLLFTHFVQGSQMTIQVNYDSSGGGGQPPPPNGGGNGGGGGGDPPPGDQPPTSPPLGPIGEFFASIAQAFQATIQSISNFFSSLFGF